MTKCENKPTIRETTEARAPAEEDTLRRYVELAIEIEACSQAAAGDLTKPVADGSVLEGIVDPGTFKTTG